MMDADGLPIELQPLASCTVGEAELRLTWRYCTVALEYGGVASTGDVRAR